MTDKTELSYYYDLEHVDPATNVIRPYKAEYYRRVIVLYPVMAPQPSRTKLMASRRCPYCARTRIQYMTRTEYKTIKEGGWVGRPSLSEMFITGICDECWPSEPDE